MINTIFAEAAVPVNFLTEPAALEPFPEGGGTNPGSVGLAFWLDHLCEDADFRNFGTQSNWLFRFLAHWFSCDLCQAAGKGIWKKESNSDENEKSMRCSLR